MAGSGGLAGYGGVEVRGSGNASKASVGGWILKVQQWVGGRRGAGEAAEGGRKRDSVRLGLWLGLDSRTGPDGGGWGL